MPHNLYGTNETDKADDSIIVDIVVFNSVEHILHKKYDFVIIDEAHKVFVPKVLKTKDEEPSYIYKI